MVVVVVVVVVVVAVLFSSFFLSPMTALCSTLKHAPVKCVRDGEREEKKNFRKQVPTFSRSNYSCRSAKTLL